MGSGADSGVQERQLLKEASPGWTGSARDKAFELVLEVGEDFGDGVRGWKGSHRDGLLSPPQPGIR